MKVYWVTGGIYTDTTFKALAAGQEMQRHGPFYDYDEARDKWQSLAWANVDDCQAYFTIETEEKQAEPEFWVLGGVYETPKAEKAVSEDRFGPFANYEDAKDEWQRLAWSTVDDANARYRIETIKPAAVDADEEPKEKLAYRVLTGPDNKLFCERVSKALADGYVLHGAPALTTRGGQVIVAQALVLGEQA